MSVSGIRDIVCRYYKDDRLCQVSYAIKLTDGRTIRLDIPSSHELSEATAKEYARKEAEHYMVRLLSTEHETGRYTCCNGITHYKAAGHRPNCPAVN